MKMIPQDKANHALANVAAFIAGAATGRWLLGTFRGALLMGVALALAASIYKEVIRDKLQGKGTPDWRDMLANLCGILLGVTAFILGSDFLVT